MFVTAMQALEHLAKTEYPSNAEQHRHFEQDGQVDGPARRPETARHCRAIPAPQE